MGELADVLVVGGGVIGLTTAYYLAGEGIRVAVLDQGEPGRQASWAGAGIIPPGNLAGTRSPIDQLRALGSSLYPGLSAALREETGQDNGYRVCGGVEIAAPEEDIGQDLWQAEGVPFRYFPGDHVREAEPALAAGLPGGYLLSGMAQVRNPWHLRALQAALVRRGVALIANQPVRGFQLSGRRVLGVLTESGPLSAGSILVAAGAWTSDLLRPLGWEPQIVPVRGQILLLRTEPGQVRRVILSGKRYLVPREDGRVLIGSTEENVGFDARTTEEGLGELRTFVSGLVPILANAPQEAGWAGLRPGSPDGVPYLGKVPGFDNLLVAAGHFRAGLQLSPATGQALACSLLGKAPPLSLEPFRPGRPSGLAGQPAFRS